VVTVDVRQLSTGASGGLPEGATVMPPDCGQGLGATTVSPEDFGVVVAPSATAPDGVTVEVLAESEQVRDAVPAFDELVERCPRVTVDAPTARPSPSTSSRSTCPTWATPATGCASRPPSRPPTAPG
jgi:hypothetical protein